MNNVFHILYVEDNEGDAELLAMCIQRYLSSEPISLEVAETVAQAKELFNVDKHCAVLIDWNLPDGEGVEVAAFIRLVSLNVPLFFLSGCLRSQHLKQAEQYTPTACLEKDYNKDFIEYLWSYLTHHSGVLSEST